MYEEKTVLCACSAYEQKYYFNEDFSTLPQSIQDDLKILCVLFTEDIGGVLTLAFDEAGNLKLETSAREGDYLYDDIGSVLKIKQIQSERKELFESLEMYYKVFFLGEELEEKGVDDPC